MKKDMDRRGFLRKVGEGGMLAAAADARPPEFARPNESKRILSIGQNMQYETYTEDLREFLEDKVIPKPYVDYFLSEDNRCWSRFDPELGYVPKGAVLEGGVDGAKVFMSYEATGERTKLNSASDPCRLNTYGNSFTEGIQVSDGETWQEALAAHLGEPIRNFGAGGYGVYQAYRRMLRQEATANAAEYVILNVFDDDHFRSLHQYRGITWKQFPDEFEMGTLAQMFHANPWVHLKVDPETGGFIECENPYDTPESLYKLCDKEHVVEAFKDDFTVQMIMARKTGRFSDPEKMAQLCEVMGVEGSINDPEECRRMADELHMTCALKSTMYLCGKAREFAESNGKQLMIMLSYGGGNVIHACQGKPRFDQRLVDYFVDNDFLLFDSLQSHVEDFGKFDLSPEAYVQRYYNGHYKPLGNLFYAFAVKDMLVDWLDPKPPMYR